MSTKNTHAVCATVVSGGVHLGQHHSLPSWWLHTTLSFVVQELMSATFVTAAQWTHSTVCSTRHTMSMWQQSLANAKVTAQRNLWQINAKNVMLKSTFSGLQCCRWQYGSIFIRLAVVASQICEIKRNYPKIWTYSSEWVID